MKSRILLLCSCFAALPATSIWAQSGVTDTSGCAAHLNTLDSPTAEALLSCLVKVESSIAALEAREPTTGPYGSNAAFPVGAVVAFVSACPDVGWAPYFPAAGRFIIGAGPHGEASVRNTDENGVALTIYQGPSDLAEETLRHPTASNTPGNNRIGGSEAHTLTAEEIPEHRHSGTTDAMNRTDHIVMENVGPHSSNNHFIGHSGRGNDRNPKDNEYPPGASHRHFFDTDINRDRETQPHNNMPPYIALYFCKKLPPRVGLRP